MAASTTYMGNLLWQRQSVLAIFGICAAALVFATLAASSRWINQPFPGFFIHENLTVGPYSLPGWSGVAAGIMSLDRVVSVDGRKPQSRREFYDIVKGRPAGTQFRYRLMRGQQVFELTISSMR
ncbi:MAG: hypothetical protein OEN50_11490, partial [Deltaproteobacteria bacterium]|nr:hypothetical protein [Deltaproteobacteria bacterium]